MSAVSVLVSGLPVDPSKLPTIKAIAACREVYSIRDQIVGVLGIEDALEALRRIGAIEKYVKDKEHKADASYAARILETAVGAALGPAEHGGDRKSKNQLPHVEVDLSDQDRNRFRLMYEYRQSWWPLIEQFKPAKKHMPRRERIVSHAKLLPPASETLYELTKLCFPWETFVETAIQRDRLSSSDFIHM